MSKQASKTLIGAFVVGALALAVIGIIIFGSGKFLHKGQKFVMFFDSSVKGLQVGSPVTFRGVKIGEVTDIVLHFDTKTMSVLIPVYAEIHPEKFKTDVKVSYKPYQYYQTLVDKGLKARLELQSIVTGQLMIGVDFYPDKPARLVGLEKKYPEIPTIPSGMEELTRTLQNLPLQEIAGNLNKTLEAINSTLHSPELTASIASLNKALHNLDRLTQNLDNRIGPLASNIESTSNAARSAFVQLEKTASLKEGVPGELASGIRDTLQAARLALSETQRAVESIRRSAAQNANIGYELNRSLEQINALSRSLRSLADYLDRHPEALIRGKVHPKEDEK